MKLNRTQILGALLLGVIGFAVLLLRWKLAR
jgi:preprotein translocase subunit Sss1